MYIEYAPKLALSDLVKRLKGRSSRLIEQEFAHIQKRHWGRHFWVLGYGTWSTGNIMEDAVQEYLKHHRPKSNKETDSFILED
jgi:putative transposase